MLLLLLLLLLLLILLLQLLLPLLWNCSSQRQLEAEVGSRRGRQLPGQPLCNASRASLVLLLPA